MTNATSVIRQKEIQNILEEHCGVSWYSLDRILQKLDDEDLKDLQAVFEELVETAENAETAYNDGYEDGHANGYQEGYDAPLDESED